LARTGLLSLKIVVGIGIFWRRLDAISSVHTVLLFIAEFSLAQHSSAAQKPANSIFVDTVLASELASLFPLNPLLLLSLPVHALHVAKRAKVGAASLRGLS
jgi:hypothetical protein